MEPAAAYVRWRAARLDGYPFDPSSAVVEIADPARPTAAERRALLERVRRYNFAIYGCARPVGPGELLALGRAIGLRRMERDPVSVARAPAPGAAEEFIPFTDRALNWHTDGYYNPPDRPIRAFLLHCVLPAARGGADTLVDHEIAWCWIRDAGEDLVAALSHPGAMTIPAHERDGAIVRPERIGPVFTSNPITGVLHARYTARTRSIRWREDPATRAAVERLRDALAAGGPHHVHVRLEAGQGIACNNVLHRRERFEDGPDAGRHLLRIRYHDRIAER